MSNAQVQCHGHFRSCPTLKHVPLVSNDLSLTFNGAIGETYKFLAFSHFICIQTEDMEDIEVKFKPTFPDICDFFSAIIDYMVISVAQLPRIEHLLFEAVEDLDITFIKTVQVEEEVVVDAKERIKTVVFANSHGPLK